IETTSRRKRQRPTPRPRSAAGRGARIWNDLLSHFQTFRSPLIKARTLRARSRRFPPLPLRKPSRRDRARPARKPLSPLTPPRPPSIVVTVAYVRDVLEIGRAHV